APAAAPDRDPHLLLGALMLPERDPDPAYLADPPAETRPIVLVGAGGIARDAHLPAYRKAGFPVDAVVDVDDDKAARLAADFDVPTSHSDITEAVATHGRDVVYDVAVMPGACATILQALPRGAAVQLQKPLGYTDAQARELVDLVQHRDLVAAVNTQLRFAPQVRAARQLVADGTIGELVDLEVLVRVQTPWQLFPSVF